jgi:malonyl-CoA decarboxylase
MQTSFFADLLHSIAARGRAILHRAQRGGVRPTSESLIGLCEDLLSRRGEASGVALARDVLAQFADLTPDARLGFFETLASLFGPDHERLTAAVEAWQRDPTVKATVELSAAVEPRRQELFRRLNLAPGGTALLVEMRRQFLESTKGRADLAAIDADFAHLFASWFNRGFLLMRRIDWSTSASILEKIVRYEAVHAIDSWDDLRGRIEPPDRRCYAFFHPALVDEPLIFVQVALTRGIPDAIGPILAKDRAPLSPEKANTATFYSISNCQRGLVGISFGHFLIKQVAEEVSREHPGLSTFVTLSPVPGFAKWLARERTDEGSALLDAHDRAALRALDTPDWHTNPAQQQTLHEPLLRASAAYLVTARGHSGTPLDPVARFHLGNGARLERVNWLADTLPKGLSQSHGVMANYLYDLGKIERNHEAYVEHHTVLASSSVQRLARASTPAQSGVQPADDPASPTEISSSNEATRLRPVGR